jgi:hypothetical protein
MLNLRFEWRQLVGNGIYLDVTMRSWGVMTLRADGCLSVSLTTPLLQLEHDVSVMNTEFWYVKSYHDFAWRFNARGARDATAGSTPHCKTDMWRGLQRSRQTIAWQDKPRKTTRTGIREDTERQVAASTRWENEGRGVRKNESKEWVLRELLEIEDTREKRKAE